MKRQVAIQKDYRHKSPGLAFLQSNKKKENVSVPCSDRLNQSNKYSPVAA